MADVSLPPPLMRGGRDPFRLGRRLRAKPRLERVVRALPALLYMGGIFLVSSVPGQNLPKVADDRIEHFSEYFVLALLLWIMVAGFVSKRARATHVLTSWAIAVLYGASDELHQSFVPGRDASFGDLAFDVLGAATALIGLALVVEWTEGKT